MLRKISRKDCLNKYTILPWSIYDSVKDEEEYFYPEVFKGHVLTLHSKTFKGHIRLLSTELSVLTLRAGFDKLIFLGMAEVPWLYQENDHRPVRDALQYLRDQGVGKRFSGALAPDRPELSTFIQHLSWLIRCNASLPIIHFTAPEQNILGSICQYGNLHLESLNETAETMLKTCIEKSRFEYVTGNGCSNQFDRTSAISGRQIVI